MTSPGVLVDGLLASGLPARRIPELNPLHDRDEHTLAVEARVLAEPIGDTKAALRIDGAVFSVSEDGVEVCLGDGIERVSVLERTFNALGEVIRGERPDSSIHTREHQ